MAISATMTTALKVDGLTSALELRKQFNTTTTPTAVTHQRRTQAVADTAEALDLGDISTVEYIIIYCVSNDLGIDCDFDSSFDEDIVVQEGEVAMFKPSGVVQVKNNDAGETSEYEYVVVGTT